MFPVPRVTNLTHFPPSAVLKKKTNVMTRGVQSALNSLAVEYLPKLISYMPRIKTARQGGCGCMVQVQQFPQVVHNDAAPLYFSFDVV